MSEEQAARERAARAGSRSRSVGSAMRARNRGLYYVSSCALSSRASSTPLSVILYGPPTTGVRPRSASGYIIILFLVITVDKIGHNLRFCFFYLFMLEDIIGRSPINDTELSVLK